MISQLLGACESIAGFAIRRGNDPASRVSRIGMPNGFFLNDLLWFGDGSTKKNLKWFNWEMYSNGMEIFGPLC